MLKIFLLSSFLWCCSLLAIQVPLHESTSVTSSASAPWFTGPLLAPSSVTVPPHRANVEPYIYAVANTGRYGANWKVAKTENFWNNSFQPSIQLGITNWLDFQFNPTVFYNRTQGVCDGGIGDMPIGLDFQLFHPKRELTQWNTALKLAIKETLPLGKYQNLNPKKKFTDAGGGGSWQTSLGLVWGSVFYLGGNHFLTWRNSFRYTLPAPVRVKNLNAYGGGRGTNGTVYPAQSFQIDTAIEINFTQRWAFAVDILGNWSGKTRFKGNTISPNTAPSSIQISLAPAIEYNWSSQMGIIFGSWFTVAGRNAVQFSSGVFAFNWFI